MWKSQCVVVLGVGVGGVVVKTSSLAFLSRVSAHWMGSQVTWYSSSAPFQRISVQKKYLVRFCDQLLEGTVLVHVKGTLTLTEL